MKYLCGLRLWLLCLMVLGAVGRVAAQAPGWAWANSPGSGYANGTITDAAGNVYVTGSFSGTAIFGSTTLRSAGSEDVFVAKLSNSGTYQWAVRAGGFGAERATAIALDGSGQLLVSGYFSGNAATFGLSTLASAGSTDVFVAKLTPAGAWRWATQAGGAGNDRSLGVFADSNDAVYLTGQFSDTAAFGTTVLISAGNIDAFVAKLTTGGTWEWATSVSGTGQEFGSGVTVDNAGNVVVTGVFQSDTTTFGPITLLNGAFSQVFFSQVFVAKLTSAGAWLWAAGPSGTGMGSAHGNGIATDATGQIYVTGGFGRPITLGSTTLPSAGFADAFVAKLSPAGIWLWAIQAGGSGLEEGLSVAVGGNGEVYVTGSFGSFNDTTAIFGTTQLTSAGGQDVFVAKLTAAGGWQWVTRAGGQFIDQGRSVAVDRNGDVAISGVFTSDPTVFGGTTVPNPYGGGFFAGFIAHLSAITGLPEPPPAAPFTLAPNPAHATVSLTGAPGAPGATATLFDGLGRVVRTVPLSAGAATLDVRGLASGLYMVRCGGAARRLVVE